MKKIFNIIFVVACLPFFWACETERDNPVALTPDSFVLNTPKYVSGVYDLKNTESIQFTTSQPEYGFTAATTYRVQIATQKEFKDFVTLPTAFCHLHSWPFQPQLSSPWQHLRLPSARVQALELRTAIASV